MNIKIRREIPDDYDAITLINDLAFKQKQEGDLITNLRNNPEFLSELSLVAELDNMIVGHILFFPVSIISGEDKIKTLSLAPMAVRPGFQNRGVGGDLILTGLKAANELGFTSAVVLGHPKYYPKFGFRKASKWKIRAPFETPDEAMLAIELKNGSLDFGGGTIEYPKEYFDAM